MSHLKVAELKTVAKVHDEEAAMQIREMADDVDNGLVEGCVVVRLMKNGSVISYTNFNNRLTTIGALEHAKTLITEG